MDSYLDSFDGQIEKMNARLEQDKQYWRERESNVDEMKQQQTEQMLVMLAKLQEGFASLLFEKPKEPVFDLSNCPIKDMAYFNDRRDRDGDILFRWPTQAQL